jgi:hypothetical protein
MKFDIKAWQAKYDSEGVTKGGIINNVDHHKAYSEGKGKSLIEKKKLLTKKRKTNGK